MVEGGGGVLIIILVDDAPAVESKDGDDEAGEKEAPPGRREERMFLFVVFPESRREGGIYGGEGLVFVFEENVVEGGVLLEEFPVDEALEAELAISLFRVFVAHSIGAMRRRGANFFKEGQGAVENSRGLEGIDGFDQKNGVVVVLLFEAVARNLAQSFRRLVRRQRRQLRQQLNDFHVSVVVAGRTGVAPLHGHEVGRRLAKLYWLFGIPLF